MYEYQQHILHIFGVGRLLYEGKRHSMYNMNFRLPDYKEQACSNIYALRSSIEYKRKYDFLCKFTQYCSERRIRWALCCSALIFIKGIWGEFHDFDIIVHPDDIEAMVELLKTIGVEQPILNDQSVYTSIYFNKFKIESIEMDIISEWGIRSGADFVYQYNFDSDELEFLEVSEKLTIPLIPLEAQYLLYRMMCWFEPNRRIKADFISLYLQSYGLEHPTVFKKALTQKLPYWANTEVKDFMKGGQ